MNRKLDIPSIPFETVYDDCIKGTHKFIDYQNAKKKLADANNNYTTKFSGGLGHTIPKEKNASSKIGKEELIYLYDGKLLNNKSPSRAHYNAIIGKPSICPFCGVNSVKTLEHFLPKAVYPFYSISPQNLIPCCYDCNLGHNKKIDVSNHDTLHLHPYFDTIIHYSWILCELTVVHGVPNFRFRIDEDCDSGSTSINRIKSHHALFNLDSLYSLNAGTEFNGLCRQLKNSFTSGGSTDVIAFLNDSYTSYSENTWHYWKPAFFKSLSENEWILNGDFMRYDYR